MFRVDTPTATAVMPPLKSAGTPGYFTEGGAGQSPTVPGADWFNMMQEEVMGVLSAAGVVPDKTKMNQLALAVKQLISESNSLTEGEKKYRLLIISGSLALEEILP